MEQYIINILNKYGIIYTKIDESNIPTIYDLFKNNTIYNGNSATKYDEILLYHGVYYSIELNYEKMKKYFLMAVNLGNVYAMINLGNYYYARENDSRKMKKYFTMAANLNNADAIIGLGDYYKYKKKYKKMKKYYLAAFNLNNFSSIIRLGDYYRYIKENYQKMNKYYLMAVDKNPLSKELSHVTYYYKNNISNITINDGLYIANKCNIDDEFYLLKNAISKGYYIDLELNGESVNKYKICVKIKLLMLSTIRTTIKKKIISKKYIHILLLLYVMKKSNICIDKYIKLTIIYYYLKNVQYMFYYNA